MANKQFVEKLRQAIEANRNRPPKERWNDLVARGAIDAEGNVLIKGPEARSTPKKGEAKQSRK